MSGVLSTPTGLAQATDLVQTELVLCPDGFNMSADLKCLPGYWPAIALDRLDFLRRGECNYRFKSLTFPLDSQQAIPIRGTDIYIERVVIGTWIWGYSFTAVDGVVADFSIQLADICEEREFFSNFTFAGAVANTAAAFVIPTLLAEPYLIGPPGRIKGQVTNNAIVAQRAQLLVHMAEPCEPPPGEGY